MHESQRLVGEPTMKALSIQQPWASMITRGEKTIEVRTWRTKYRGSLLIVSSKSPKIGDLPCGVALAIAELVDCRPMTVKDEKLARCQYEDGAFSWVLENVRPISHFPVVGRLGLYEVTVGTK